MSYFAKIAVYACTVYEHSIPNHKICLEILCMQLNTHTTTGYRPLYPLLHYVRWDPTTSWHHPFTHHHSHSTYNAQCAKWKWRDEGSSAGKLPWKLWSAGHWKTLCTNIIPTQDLLKKHPIGTCYWILHTCTCMWNSCEHTVHVSLALHVWCTHWYLMKTAANIVIYVHLHT